MRKNETGIEERVVAAYLKGRTDAQKELFQLIRELTEQVEMQSEEISRLKKGDRD